MGMVAFHSKFRDLALKEMRTAMLSRHGSLPDGPWGFLEFYCNERGCDCRRVVIQVVRPDSPRVWASINFGWEKPAFYRRWSRRDPLADNMAGSTLDPLNPQTEHSPALLALFREVACADPAYVRRLKAPLPYVQGRFGKERSRA